MTTDALAAWLQNHLEIQKQLTAKGDPDLPLMVSRDVIQSLFGKFKHMIERSSYADMNRPALLIPALCGHLDKAAIDHAHAQTRHDDLEA
jgi:hypothetical protein